MEGAALIAQAGKADRQAARLAGRLHRRQHKRDQVQMQTPCIYSAARGVGNGHRREQAVDHGVGVGPIDAESHGQHGHRHLGDVIGGHEVTAVEPGPRLCGALPDDEAAGADAQVVRADSGWR